MAKKPVKRKTYGSDKFLEKLFRAVPNQSEVARLTGIGQGTVSAIIRGEQRPYFDQMAVIAKAVKVSLDYLADDSIDEPPDCVMTEKELDVIAHAAKIGLEQAIELLMLAKRVGAEIMADRATLTKLHLGIVEGVHSHATGANSHDESKSGRRGKGDDV